jgi:hypothetical protein
MQTKNLGFTCARLDPEVYKIILAVNQKRGLKTHQAIELAVRVASLISANRETHLTPEGQAAVEALLGPKA